MSCGSEIVGLIGVQNVFALAVLVGEPATLWAPRSVEALKALAAIGDEHFVEHRRPRWGEPMTRSYTGKRTA
jgi:hypothetical protein